MSNLWLCMEKQANVPYYCPQMGVNLYTVEELCYYIFDNIYILDEEFLSTKLFEWIGKELGMERLSNMLLEGESEKRSKLWCALMILREGGYCTKDELNELKKLYQEMGNKSKIECQKIRADRLLEHKKYVSSIMEYHRILQSKEIKEAYPVLVGNVWHNLGVAHARLFLFKEAAQYFKNAHDMNKSNESLKNYLYAKACANESTMERAQQLQIEQIEQEIEQILEQTQNRAFDSMSKEINEYARNGDMEKYYGKITEFLDDLRKDYKKRVTEHGII